MKITEYPEWTDNVLTAEMATGVTRDGGDGTAWKTNEGNKNLAAQLTEATKLLQETRSSWWS